MVKGSHVAMLALQVKHGERAASSAAGQRLDHLRRHNVERAHDGNKEGKGVNQNKLHGWGVRGAVEGTGSMVSTNPVSLRSGILAGLRSCGF